MYVLLLTAAMTVAGAQAPSPCAAPEARAFDFWIGSWNVYNVDGRFVGSNEIRPEEENCALIERWRGAQQRQVRWRELDDVDAIVLDPEAKASDHVRFVTTRERAPEQSVRLLEMRF